MAGITHVAKESGLNPLRCPCCNAPIDTIELLELFFQNIIRRVKDGEKIIIRGFGVFSAKMLKGRKVKTPLMPDGEARFKDQLILRFHQSVVAKEELNKKIPVRKKRKSAGTKTKTKTKGKGKKK